MFYFWTKITINYWTLYKWHNSFGFINNLLLLFLVLILSFIYTIYSRDVLFKLDINKQVIPLCLFFFFRIAPIGVCSLAAARVAGMDDILKTMGKLGLYIVTVLCGLFVHALIVLPVVFFVFTRKNPYTFMKGVSDALMTAFGIASRFVAQKNIFSFLLQRGPK